MKKIRTWMTIGVCGAFIVAKVIAKKYDEDKIVDDDNDYLREKVTKVSPISASIPNSSMGKAEDREEVNKESTESATFTHTGDRITLTPTIYERVIKPILDSVLSFIALMLLTPLFLVISIAVFIDDPGTVFFTQKRIGRGKHYFYLHKFRTMKMDSPTDVPTHLLERPERYITKMGAVLRRSSLDELPQLWDIFRGRMSVIGPRPALWNQRNLVAERDKWGANDVLPGLTGWAQINGRDELDIVDKAELDGSYVAALQKNSWSGLRMDIRCFLGTIKSVLYHDGVVEGGTGTIISS